MSIELKQAAQRAIEMLTASSTFFSTRSALMTDECRAAAEELRTAIQQAEAHAGEPVYQICKADSVSISTAWVDVQKQQYDDAAVYPEYGRRVLYTHPASGVQDALKDHQIAAMVNSLRDIARQFHGHDSLRERIANVLVPALKPEAKTGVPEDVVRDVISTVREQYRGTDWGKAAECICDAIDAAMLADK